MALIQLCAVLNLFIGQVFCGLQICTMRKNQNKVYWNDQFEREAIFNDHSLGTDFKDKSLLKNSPQVYSRNLLYIQCRLRDFAFLK